MKKVLISILFSIFLISCGAPKVQRDFEKLLNDLKRGNVAKAQKINLDMKSANSLELIKLSSNGYKKMTYKIKNTKVEGDTAVINLDMKVPNFVSYLIEFFQEVEKASSSNSKLNNEKPLNYVDFYNEKLNSKDLNYLEKNINVYFKKNGKDWELDKEKNKDFYMMMSFGI